jgi:hypothetical protein
MTIEEAKKIISKSTKIKEESSGGGEFSFYHEGKVIAQSGYRLGLGSWIKFFIPFKNYAFFIREDAIEILNGS